MSESRNLSDFFLVAICVCTESFFQTCLFTGSWFLYLPVTECMNMLWLFWFFRFVRSVWNRWILVSMISRVLWFTWLTWFVLRFYNWFCCAAVSGNCFSICNPNSFFREFVYDFLVANGYQNVFLYDMVFGICDGVSENVFSVCPNFDFRVIVFHRFDFFGIKFHREIRGFCIVQYNPVV